MKDDRNIKNFGNRKRICVSVTLSPEVVGRLDEESKRIGLSRSITVELLLRKAFDLLPTGMKGGEKNEGY